MNLNLNLTQEKWDYWYNRVYGYFYRRVTSRHDVEDLTTSTLGDFFLKNEEIQNENGLMWTIAKNKLLTYIRDKGKHQHLNFDELENSISFEDIPSPRYQDKLDRLQVCIQKQLNTADHKIMQLSIVSDFSSQRIAEESGLTSSNVRQRLSRSIKKVRKHCADIWSNLQHFIN